MTDEWCESIDRRRSDLARSSNSAWNSISPFLSGTALTMFSTRRNTNTDVDDALATAYLLGMAYLDAMLDEPVISQSLADEFLEDSIERCAEQLRSFTATGSLYHASLLFCGMVSGLTLLTMRSPNLSEPIIKKYKIRNTLYRLMEDLDERISDYYLPQLSETDDMGTKEAMPYRSEENAFVMFWLNQAINIALAEDELFENIGLDRDSLKQHRRAFGRYAESRLSSWVANYYAKVGQNTSADIVYWVALALVSSSAGERERLIDHALSILMDKFFSDGCFLVSRSIVVDEARKVGVVCSTTEMLDTLLYADFFYRAARPGEDKACQCDQAAEPSQNETSCCCKSRRGNIGNLPESRMTDHFDKLYEHFDWLKRHQSGNLFIPDRDTYQGEPTAQIAVAGVAFLNYTKLLADELLDQYARRMLGVRLLTKEPPMKSYPDYLKFLKDSVVEPIRKGGGGRKSAYYSMILYGPPGSAKTTLARRMAWELDWPYVEITQRDFLARGQDLIDASADRMFRYCGYLRNVVILFDELEELILDRERTNQEKESRLLTTSMLPRIQALRDAMSVVFIFATNRLDMLDPAATRPGRFDIVKYIRFPEPSEKKKTLEEQSKKLEKSHPLLAEVMKSIIDDKDNPLQDCLSKHMSYTDLSRLVDLVKKITNARMATTARDADRIKLREEVMAQFGRYIENSRYGEAVSKCQELSRYDRP